MSAILPSIAVLNVELSGTQYWRVKNPLSHIQNRKIVIPDPYSQEFMDNTPQILTSLDQADILFASNPSPILYQFLSDYRNTRNLGAMEAKDTEFRLVFDYDDDIFNIPPTNPMYGFLGLQDVTVKLNGETKDLWKTGNTYSGHIGGKYIEYEFDPEHNAKERLKILDMMKLADVLTTTTPYMVKQLSGYIGVDDPLSNRVIAIHNAPDHMVFYPEVKQDREEVSILWTISTSHFMDFARLRKVLGDVLRKNHNAHLYIMGDKFGLGRDIPLSRVTFLPWVEGVDNYAKVIRELTPDIGICYVEDNKFNLGKSILKWEEMTAIGATTVCSQALYGDYLTYKEHTLLADTPEMVGTHLDMLINDKNLRESLLATADNYYRAHYSLEQAANKYSNLFYRLSHPSR